MPGQYQLINLCNDEKELINLLRRYTLESNIIHALYQDAPDMETMNSLEPRLKKTDKLLKAVRTRLIEMDVEQALLLGDMTRARLGL